METKDRNKQLSAIFFIGRHEVVRYLLIRIALRLVVESWLGCV